MTTWPPPWRQSPRREWSCPMRRGTCSPSPSRFALCKDLYRSFKLCILLERCGCSPQLVEGDQFDRAEDRGRREEAGHGEFPSRYRVSMEPSKNTFSRCSCRPRSTGRRWRRSCGTSAKTSLPSLTTSSLPKLPTQSPRWNTGHVDGWIIQLGYVEDYGGHIMVKVSKVSL